MVLMYVVEQSVLEKEDWVQATKLEQVRGNIVKH